MYLCTVKPVLGGHPQEMAFHRIGKKCQKMPFYDVTDHLINKNSLKLLQTSISGENYGLNFTKKIILSFNGVLLIDVIVHYRWKTIKVTTTT